MCDVLTQELLVKENCSFVTSVIQGLTRNFAGKLLAGKKATWSERHAPSTTGNIFNEFRRQLRWGPTWREKRLNCGVPGENLISPGGFRLGPV